MVINWLPGTIFYWFYVWSRTWCARRFASCYQPTKLLWNRCLLNGFGPPPIQDIFFFASQSTWDWIPPPRFLYTKKVPQQKFRLNNHPTLELWKKNEQKSATSQRICGLFDADGKSDPKTSSPKWWWKNGDESHGIPIRNKKTPGPSIGYINSSHPPKWRESWKMVVYAGFLKCWGFPNNHG